MNEYEFILKDTIAKTKSVLKDFDLDKVRIAYSGGSDSDTTMWIVKMAGFDVKAVVYDTGIEYQATYDHVEYMRQQGFNIDVIKAKMPVPTSNRKFGHPFISKRIAEMIERLQRHGFDFQTDGKLSFEEAYAKFPNSKSALRWWHNDWGEKSKFNIEYNKYLKEFLIEHGLPFKVSGKCCNGAKKNPIKDYANDYGLDLMILGIRKSEGGARSTAYKSCYQPRKNYKYDMYFPLFWWKNDMKVWFDETYNIKRSDCYEVYGLKRTGCAGCPFGLDFENELKIIDAHEPKLSKGIRNIFNPSYEWTRKYHQFREEVKLKERN